MASKVHVSNFNCRLFRVFYIHLVFLIVRMNCASIPWGSRDTESSSGAPAFSGVWYFQTGRSLRTKDGTRFFASDNLPSISDPKCDEPKNLPQQFMDWFRESTSDPTILTLTVAGSQSNSKSISQSLDSLVVDSDVCSLAPSTNADASTMERALCPWEWRLNRDERREPKLISEAKCLCRRSRGPVSTADCVAIQREFPVLRRIYCDENGNYQYVKSYETITVGCHSVMPRMSRAPPAPWLLRPKEV